jgi:hypothetical protein
MSTDPAAGSAESSPRSKTRNLRFRTLSSYLGIAVGPLVPGQEYLPDSPGLHDLG